MKILLINPPFTNYGGLEGHGGKAPPLNLGYLAAYVRDKKRHYGSSILDAEVLGMTFEQIEDHIKRDRPDIVGITSSTPAYISAIRISKICKDADPGIKVVMGGIHPSAFPTETAMEDTIDFVVVGEGEITFLELLNAIENRSGYKDIAGIAYKESGRIVRNRPRDLIDNLDMLPFPARDLMPHSLYSPPPTKRVSTFKATSLTSARGCPYNCNFCSAHVIWTRRYRYRSPGNVIDEMQQCITDFDIREFAITDELFTLNKERALAFCEGLLKRRMGVAWVCMSRAGQVDEQLLRLMKQAGCKEISFGLESGDEEVLSKIIHKKNTLEAARQSIRLVKKAGIRTHASYMIGNIGETEETIRKTINFAKELNTDIAAFFIATPLPGTELYEEAVKSGYIRTGVSWNDFSPLSKGKPVMSLPNLSSEDLLRWHRRAIREYYLRPRYILKKIFGLRSKVDFLNIYNGLRLFCRLEQNQ
jgi:radical SAM superfamily enzyme YgiQ (UPF0313 family)